MKKLLAGTIVLALSMTAFACGDATEETKAETNLPKGYELVEMGSDIDTYQHKKTGCYFSYTRYGGNSADLEQIWISVGSNAVPYCEK